jgi:hypothetical protein
MFHACRPLAHRIKMVLKASVRHIPGAGNIWSYTFMVSYWYKQNKRFRNQRAIMNEIWLS